MKSFYILICIIILNSCTNRYVLKNSNLHPTPGSDIVFKAEETEADKKLKESIATGVKVLTVGFLAFLSRKYGDKNAN